MKDSRESHFKCPSIQTELTFEEGSASLKKKPLLIYVICVIYLCSGLKELFAVLIEREGSGSKERGQPWTLDISQVVPDISKGNG